MNEDKTEQIKFLQATIKALIDENDRQREVIIGLRAEADRLLNELGERLK